MEQKEREIDTRLGRRVVDMERVIHFPQGLVGFEEEREFVLLQLRPDAAMLILQSMKTPQLGLLVADPFSFIDSFKPVVGEAEMALLQLQNLDDAAILVTVSIPNGQPDNATKTVALFIYQTAFTGTKRYAVASAASMMVFIVICIFSAFVFFIMRDKDEAAQLKAERKRIREYKKTLKAQGGRV